MLTVYPFSVEIPGVSQDTPWVLCSRRPLEDVSTNLFISAYLRIADYDDKSTKIETVGQEFCKILQNPANSWE